jgi:hypothetical protein
LEASVLEDGPNLLRSESVLAMFLTFQVSVTLQHSLARLRKLVSPAHGVDQFGINGKPENGSDASDAPL